MVMVSFNTLIFPNDVNNAKNTQSHTSNIINNKPLLLFDTLGFFVLLLYMAFSVSRTWLFGHWIHGSVLTAFTYSILAGVMLGRIVGMRLKIKNILAEQSISV
jgi:hypothetical protein